MDQLAWTVSAGGAALVLAAHWLATPWWGRGPRYVRTAGLLTPAERHFFYSLERRVPPGYRLSFKVRLADVVTVRCARGGRQFWWAFGPIAQKHVDFVVCDAGFCPVLAVELDDASHRRADRARRDRFVDQAMASAGVPLVRVRAAREYPTAVFDRVFAPLRAGPVAGGGLSPRVA
jgi:Protein of unknown function (DUF2726)